MFIGGRQKNMALLYERNIAGPEGYKHIAPLEHKTPAATSY